jgi:hypothetical protein
LPSTRSTFHAGRASPGGRAAPGTLCQRPSTLTHVPEVSANAATGRITVAQAFCSSPAYGVSATTQSAPCSADALADDGTRSAISIPPTST